MTALRNIAIVSTNKDKYSETFIHNVVKHLPGNIHFLFDGYLPKQYSTDKGIITAYIEHFGNKKWFNLRQPKQGVREEQLRLSIENYLLTQNIQVLLCEYGPSGVEMMDIATKLNIPLVVHFHGYDAYRSDILNSYGKKYTQLFKVASSVIAVSTHMQQHLVAIGCPPEKLHLLPCGIDVDFFSCKNSTEKKYTFVFCGRFVAKKSPDTLIKAFANVLNKMPRIRLLMIGDGELMDYTKSLATKLGISSQVEFRGVQSPAQVAEAYCASHIYIQHSVTTSQNDAEGTPNSLLESAAAGLPAIGSRHGGITEVIEEGQTGFLVDENDLITLEERMLYMAQHPDIAAELGLKASARIRKFYNLDTYIKKLSGILNTAVSPQ